MILLAPPPHTQRKALPYKLDPCLIQETFFKGDTSLWLANITRTFGVLPILCEQRYIAPKAFRPSAECDTDRAIRNL